MRMPRPGGGFTSTHGGKIIQCVFVLRYSGVKVVWADSE
jgi:hypothetical protein